MDEDSATYGIYASHASREHHSTYLGRTIIKATSWITTSVRWFSGDLSAETLKRLRQLIRAEVTGKPTTP